MPSDALIEAHCTVQHAAKLVLANLADQIFATSTEESIAATAHRELCRPGFPDTWYYACPAFVLERQEPDEQVRGSISP